MYNLKIEEPCDDNYSDDELTFFSYYTFLTNVQDPLKVSGHRVAVLLLLTCVDSPNHNSDRLQ